LHLKGFFYQPNDSEIFNILKMLLIYEQYSFFNYLFDILGENKIINLINNTNKELLFNLSRSALINPSHIE